MLVNLRTARYNKRNTAAPTAAQSAANSYRSRRRLQRTNNRFLFGLRSSSSSSSSTSASWWLHRQWKQHSTVSLIPALVAATTTLCSRCSVISVSISIWRFYDSFRLDAITSVFSVTGPIRCGHCAVAGASKAASFSVRAKTQVQEEYLERKE